MVFFSCKERNEHVIWSNTDVGKKRLFGRVKYVQEKVYNVDNKGKKADIYMNEIWEFDTSGRRIVWSDTFSMEYDTEFSEKVKETYKYDNYGRQIERAGVRNGVTQKCITKYDASGRTAHSDNFRNGKLYGTDNTRYDGAGNILEDSSFSISGALRGIRRYQYDEHGDMISESFYDSSGTVAQTSLWTYDAYRNKVRENRIQMSNHHSMVSKRKYDDKGNLNEEEEFFMGKTEKRVIKYYRFDKMGNWLVKKEYLDGKLSNIEERVMEYW